MGTSYGYAFEWWTWKVIDCSREKHQVKEMIYTSMSPLSKPILFLFRRMRRETRFKRSRRHRANDSS
jgi:hypothetical protein